MSSVESQSAAYAEYAERLAAARARLTEAKEQEAIARRSATAAENAMREIESNFAKFLAEHHPTLIDQIAALNGRRR